jgi:hypothetical protein
VIVNKIRSLEILTDLHVFSSPEYEQMVFGIPSVGRVNCCWPSPAQSHDSGNRTSMYIWMHISLAPERLNEFYPHSALNSCPS